VRSKCRGLYRNFLGSGFLVEWFKLLGFKVLVGGIPFLRDQSFKSPKFRWSFSYYQLHPQCKSYPTFVNWRFIIVCRAV